MAVAEGGRSYKVDNSKVLLMVLVGVGHALEPVIRHTNEARSTYTWIYLVHMPLFAIILGWNSRRTTLGGLQRLLWY